MKRALLAVAFASSMLQAAWAAECGDAQDQGAMNECADRSYKASDSELNALYRKIEQRLADDADTRNLLIKAQRAWVAFRDAECEFSSSGASGGSIFPMMYTTCLDSLTRNRIEDFKGYLNCPEGDASSCPVPTAEDDPLGFDIELSLSPKALKKLSGQGERVVVSAAYYGAPKPSARAHADDVGRIQLGREDREVAAKPGTVRVTGANVEAGRLDWIAGDVEVNVNVFSARKSSQNNLLDCDFIDGRLADVASAPVALHCALIEENPDTKLKP